MRRIIIALCLFFIAGVSMAGRTLYIPSDETERFSWVLRDVTVTVDQYTSPCALSSQVFDGDDGRIQCVIPTGRTFTITAFGVIPMDGDGLTVDEEECSLTVEYNVTDLGATGTEISGSTIQIGPANTNGANCPTYADTDLDDRGEECIREFTPVAVTGPGWLRVKVQIGDGVCGGGACLCGDIDTGVFLFIDGYWQ